MTPPILKAVPMGEAIPKNIYQTCKSRRELSDEIRKNIAHLKSQNPDYSYTLFDDEDVQEFIANEYGPEILRVFNSISPTYGAARADLFRYLLIYQRGGFYLDIKSSTFEPLENHVLPEDRYILCHWDNAIGGVHEGWGKDLTHPALPKGEFQQWHVIASAGHPFLRAVIESTLINITSYSPWRVGVGKLAVFKTCGPICYTLAIQPLLSIFPNRVLQNEREFGLCYSCFTDQAAHKALSSSHYKTNRGPLIQPQTVGRKLSAIAYASKLSLMSKSRRKGGSRSFNSG